MSNPRPVSILMLRRLLEQQVLCFFGGCPPRTSRRLPAHITPVYHDSKHKVSCLPMLLVVSHKASCVKYWGCSASGGWSRWVVPMLDLL